MSDDERVSYADEYLNDLAQIDAEIEAGIRDGDGNYASDVDFESYIPPKSEFPVDDFAARRH